MGKKRAVAQKPRRSPSKPLPRAPSLRRPHRLAFELRGRGPLVIAAIFSALVVAGPTIAPHSPLQTSSNILVGPSLEHWLGTDALGRDVLSRVLSGGGLLVAMSLAAGAGAVLLGGTIGLVSGYRAVVLDTILMRSVDVLLTLPPMLVALLVAAMLPRNNLILVTLVAVLLSPGAARVTRGITQQIASLDFIAATEAAGERTSSILLREILPNLRGRLAVEFALRTGFAMLTISSLNFLGVGISPPTPDWGLMVAEQRQTITIAPWATLFPAFAIFLAIIITNRLADWLADRWK